MKRWVTMAVMAAMLLAGWSTMAVAGYEPFLGQIMVFGGTFAPDGWLPCDGRLLPIVQNQALFSIVGTTYGGDGINNFALPDLRGREPVGSGTAPGGATYTNGQKGGSPTISYQSFSPVSTALKTPGPSDTEVKHLSVPSAAIRPVDNLSPYLCIGYYIATQGIYPSRE